MEMNYSMGDGWMEALHPDDVAHTVAAIQETVRTGKPIDIEYRVKAPDGAWKWMWSRGSAVLGPSGEVVRVYGSVEDIELPKNVAQALDKCRAGLQATFDAVPQGMILADAPEGKVVMANHEAHRMFGDRIQPDQKIADYGKWAAMRTDGQPLKPEEYPLAGAILRGETTCAQIVVCDCNDSKRATVALSAAPIYGHNGEIVAGVMVVQQMEGAKGKS
jgi:PAS domain-containing protein